VVMNAPGRWGRLVCRGRVAVAGAVVRRWDGVSAALLRWWCAWLTGSALPAACAWWCCGVGLPCEVSALFTRIAVLFALAAGGTPLGGAPACPERGRAASRPRPLGRVPGRVAKW